MNREALKKFLPPILFDAWCGVRKSRELPEWEYAPGARVGAAGPGGWNTASVVDAELRKWPRFLELTAGASPLGIAHEAVELRNDDANAQCVVTAFGCVLHAAAAGKKSLSILDWGGGLGHYRVFAHALAPDLEILYHCKDTSFFCEAARPLHPGAIFFSNENEALAKRYDLVIASSSLQYSADWKRDLARLAAVTPYLYLARVPLVEKVPTFPVLQRAHRYGYATEYAGFFFNRCEFLETAARCGLETVREFVDLERFSVPGAPEQCKVGGFFFHAQ